MRISCRRRSDFSPQTPSASASHDHHIGRETTTVQPFTTRENTHRPAPIDIQITLALPIPTVQARAISSHSVQRRWGRTTRRGSCGRRAAWLTMLSHWIGTEWSARVHQRWHIGAARDISDGRQHVLRWARHDALRAVTGWLFGWTAIDGASAMYPLLAMR